MKFPVNVERLINNYSKPVTRADWRKGAHINSLCRNHIKCIGGGYCINIQLNEMYNSMGHVYTEKLIPDGRLEFNEDNFISAYEAFYLDKAEWE